MGHCWAVAAIHGRRRTQPHGRLARPLRLFLPWFPFNRPRRRPTNERNEAATATAHRPTVEAPVRRGGRAKWTASETRCANRTQTGRGDGEGLQVGTTLGKSLASRCCCYCRRGDNDFGLCCSLLPCRLLLGRMAWADGQYQVMHCSCPIGDHDRPSHAVTRIIISIYCM